jgi:hypothetical protein
VRRKKGAARAAVTRKNRREKRVHDIAAKILRDEEIKPFMAPSKRSSTVWVPHCAICHREISDEISISRGIGSECWQELLA